MLDLRPRPAPAETRFAADPAWRRASSNDRLDLAHLAELEGSSGLLEGFMVGGSVALLALAAMPLAPDAEVAAGRLCDQIGATTPREPLLRAIHDVVARPPPQAERQDLVGLARCSAKLRSLGGSGLSPSERDLVDSALLMLKETGAVR